MSRYDLPGREPRFRLVVGWDRPLWTFFAQVWERRPAPNGAEEEVICCWVGCAPGEVTAADYLADAVREFCDIPDDVLEQLETDKHDWL